MNYELSAALSKYLSQGNNPPPLASYSAPSQTRGLCLLLCTANTLEVHDFNPAHSYKVVLCLGKFIPLELGVLYSSCALLKLFNTE